MGKLVAVQFRADTLFAVERDDGVFVAIKPISDALGLKWSSQHDRLRRDPVLSEGILITGIPSPGGLQETTLLRLDLVNGWLFTIDEGRVKDDEVRQRVLAYKRECYAVLFRHFYGAQAVPADVPRRAEEADAPKVRMVTEARHTFGEQSAAQLWFKLGLPVVPAMVHDTRQGEIFPPSSENTGSAQAA